MSGLITLMPLILVNLLKTDYNNKTSDTKGEIYRITGLTTTTALIAVKITIPTIHDIYNKIKSNNLYITLTDYSKFTKDILDAEITKKLVNESSLNEQIKILATKGEIKTLATKVELKSRAREDSKKTENT